MMDIKRNYLLLALSFIVASCQPTVNYQMEVLRPGYSATPVGREGVLLIDNTGKQPTDYGHLYQYYFNNRLDQETPRKQDDSIHAMAFDTDTLSSYILNFLKNYLSFEAYYKSIEVAADSWIIPAKTGSMGFLQMDGLNNEQKNALRDSSLAPLWICLDRLLVQTKTNEFDYDQYSVVARDVIVRTIWRVIDVKADTVCLVFQHKDSLFWEKGDLDGISASKQLPDFASTMPEIADYVAERVYPIFGPFWQPVERMYYVTGGYRMKRAIDYLSRDDWNSAAVLWKEEYLKGFGKSVPRAAMNMILYFERAGNPEAALEWCDRAEKSFNKQILKPTTYELQVLMAWKNSLKERLNEKEKLNSYFNGKLN